jgi:hypothetical protein
LLHLSNKSFSAVLAEIVTLKYLESPADAVDHAVVKPILSDLLTLLSLLQARGTYEKRMRKWFPILAPHLREKFPEILGTLPDLERLNQDRKYYRRRLFDLVLSYSSDHTPEWSVRRVIQRQTLNFMVAVHGSLTGLILELPPHMQCHVLTVRILVRVMLQVVPQHEGRYLTVLFAGLAQITLGLMMRILSLFRDASHADK